MKRKIVTETGMQEEFLPSQARGVLKNRPQEKGVREAKALVHSVVGSYVLPLAQVAQVRGPTLQEARGMQRPTLWQNEGQGKESLYFPPPLGGSKRKTAKPEKQRGVLKCCGSQKLLQSRRREREAVCGRLPLVPATQSQQAAQRGLGEPSGELAAVPWAPSSAFAWS